MTVVRSAKNDDNKRGTLLLDVGTYDLHADDGVLCMEAAAADAERLAQVENVVERHLVRFGAKDGLNVTRTPA